MQVFRIAYCQPFRFSDKEECQHTCEEFVCAMTDHSSEFKRKVKIHLLLHLSENMIDFGPTSTFSTEKYMHSVHSKKYVFHICFSTFSSGLRLIRARNIYANR